jgi:Protein of unknown function (DUF3040)
VSLSAWEQQALDSIGDRLAGSDPGLAALLATFARLESDEEMPAGEKIMAGPGPVRRRPRRGARRACHLRPYQAALLLWLLITAALIAVAVALSNGGGKVTCSQSWSAVCTQSAPAPGWHPPATG